MGRVSNEVKQRNERLAKLQDTLDKTLADLQSYIESKIESPSRERALGTLIENLQKQIDRIKDEQAEEAKIDREDEKDKALLTFKTLESASISLESATAANITILQLQEQIRNLETENHRLSMAASDAQDKEQDVTGILHVFSERITSMPAREILAVHLILAVGRQKAKLFLDRWELGSWCLMDDTKSKQDMLDAILDNTREAPYYIRLLQVKHKMADPVQEAHALAQSRLAAKQAEERLKQKQYEADKLSADMAAESRRMEAWIENRDRIGYVAPEPSPTHDLWGAPISTTDEVLPL